MAGYEAYLKDQVDVGKLGSLSHLVRELDEEDVHIEQLEGELKEAKERRRIVAEMKIPEIMDEIRIANFTTTEGLKVAVKTVVRASIPKGSREEAFDWLDENGHSGLVKREVSVAFTRDQTEDAAKLLENLHGEFPNAKSGRSVHHSSLGAWVRDMLRDGQPVPTELFGVFEQRTAKVTKP